MTESHRDGPPSANHNKSFSPADRVAELNDIDQSVSTLLNSAADAIGVLSNSTSSLESKLLPSTLESAQTTFQKAASDYFSILSSIDVRLRRQVYALEEAGLIEVGDERDTREGRALGGDGIIRGGGGPLDTSWLNARANDKVEEGMRSELREEMKNFVNEMRKQANSERHETPGLQEEQEEQDDEVMKLDVTS